MACPELGTLLAFCLKWVLSVALGTIARTYQAIPFFFVRVLLFPGWAVLIFVGVIVFSATLFIRLTFSIGRPSSPWVFFLIEFSWRWSACARSQGRWFAFWGRFCIAPCSISFRNKCLVIFRFRDVVFLVIRQSLGFSFQSGPVSYRLRLWIIAKIPVVGLSVVVLQFWLGHTSCISEAMSDSWGTISSTSLAFHWGLIIVFHLYRDLDSI